jgi:hypothetical protein
MASLSLLLSLNLNFVPTNMAPMSIDGLNALSRLRYAPVLQTLYINLDGRFGDHHTLTALVGVKDAIRLNTLHIELEKNQIGLDDARTLVSAGRTGKRLPSGQLTFGFHRTILIWDQTPDTWTTYLRDNFLIIAGGDEAPHGHRRELGIRTSLSYRDRSYITEAGIPCFVARYTVR